MIITRSIALRKYINISDIIEIYIYILYMCFLDLYHIVVYIYIYITISQTSGHIIRLQPCPLAKDSGEDVRWGPCIASKALRGVFHAGCDGHNTH